MSVAVIIIAAVVVAACTTVDQRPAPPSPQARTEPADLVLGMDWPIKRQHTTIDIRRNGDVSVTDRLSLVVDREAPGGYLLRIPLRWPDFGAPVEIHDVEVVDTAGLTDELTMLHDHPYGIAVMIGDPQQTVRGHVSFTLRYRLTEAVRQRSAGSQTFEWLVTHEPVPAPTDVVVVDIAGATVVEISCRELVWREVRMQPAGECPGESASTNESGLRYDGLPELRGVVMTAELD